MQVLLVAAVIYAGITGGMYGMQRHLLYFPEKGNDSPADFKLSMQKITLVAEDGVALSGWYGAAPVGQPTIVYYHGNAGKLGSRPDKFRTLLAEHFGVLAVSYRGYGESEGRPTEEGIYADARAAIRYLEAQGIKEQDILLYGESLGTGVAVQMATEFPGLRAIILEAPYTSVGDRAQEVYPFIPVNLLLKDKFDTKSKIASLKRPILFLHGLKDVTIPVAHSKALLQKVRAVHKVHFFKDTAHSDFPLEEVAKKVRAFVDFPPQGNR